MNTSTIGGVIQQKLNGLTNSVKNLQDVLQCNNRCECVSSPAKHITHISGDKAQLGQQT